MRESGTLGRDLMTEGRGHADLCISWVCSGTITDEASSGPAVIGTKTDRKGHGSPLKVCDMLCRH